MYDRVKPIPIDNSAAEICNAQIVYVVCETSDLINKSKSRSKNNKQETSVFKWKLYLEIYAHAINFTRLSVA